MVIDPSISIGNILTIVGLIVGGVLFLAKFGTHIQVIVTRIEQIDKELAAMRDEVRQLALTTDRIGTVLIEMATQRTKLDAIDKRVDDSNDVRKRMQADLEARFNGLEERLRAVEALSHAKTIDSPKKRLGR